MRVVILGAGGFIGSALQTFFHNQKINIVCPDSSQINLLDQKSIEQLQNIYRRGDRLIILACLAPYRERGIEGHDKNLLIANHICNSISNIITHITYLSSDAVYGSSNRVVFEGLTPSPDTTYGQMHLSRETIFSKFGDRLAIVRPTMVVGAGDPHNAYGPNRFIRTALHDNEVTLFGEGEELRDYISLEDLIPIIAEISLLLKTGFWNVASGESYTFFEIASKILTYLPETQLKKVKREATLTHREFKSLRIRAELKYRPSNIMTVLDRYFEDCDAEI